MFSCGDRSSVRVSILGVVTYLLMSNFAVASSGSQIMALGSELRFELNQGQASPDARFISHGSGYMLSLTPEGARLTLRKNGGVHGVVGMKLERAARHVNITGIDTLKTVTNYSFGRDSRGWHAGIPNYGKVKYSGVYRGVDLIFYGNDGQLEFDFNVRAGADPRAIQLSLEGVEKLDVDEQGNLILKIGGGDIRLRKPVAYQEIGGIKFPVQSSYILTAGNRVSFEIGDYNHSAALVIDPLLTYSRYLGRGMTDYGNAIAVDSNGNTYVAGLSTGVTTSDDAFVAKLDPTGGGGANGAPLYIHYFGGAGATVDSALGVAVDSAGNAYVTGLTQSPDFPTTAGAVQTSFSGAQDAFVAKFNASGTLTYGTYLGGGGKDTAFSIAVDNGSPVLAYVTGATSSANFPVTSATAFQASNLGSPNNAFVTVLSTDPTSTANLKYSTYLGGGGSDQGNGIAVASGRVYVTGSTSSWNFPTGGCALPSPQASGVTSGAFVTVFTPGSGGLFFSRHLGGSMAGDSGNGIAVDTAGNVYVAGQTNGGFPITSNALRTSPTNGDPGEAFVTALNPTTCQFIYSTYLGGSGYDAAHAIAVNPSNGTVYVAGETSSSDFPLVDPVQVTNTGGDTSAFLTEISVASNTPQFQRSTTLGGTQYDTAFGVAAHAATGDVFLTGLTLSTDFPVAGPAGVNAGQTFPLGNTVAGFVTGIPLLPALPAISTVNVPPSIASGSSGTGTATLAAAAPAGGAVLTLNTTSSLITIPTAVAVAAGQTTSANFQITAGNGTGNATITAKLGSSTKTASVGVGLVPPTIQGFGFNTTDPPGLNYVLAGSPVFGAVTINPPQSTNTSITLSSNNSHVTVPATVTVPAGTTEVYTNGNAGFNAQTTDTDNPILVTLTAKIGSGPVTTTSFYLYPAPRTVSSLTLNPTTVAGGSPSTATLTLSGNAPTAGLAVSVTSTTSYAVVPAGGTVTVPGGQKTVTFQVTTTEPPSPTSATITASVNASSQSAVLQINPPVRPTFVPFAAFTADVKIQLDKKDDDKKTESDSFDADGTFKLGAQSNGIHPDKQDVTFSLASYSVLIPAGSFKLEGAADKESGGDDDPDTAMHWTFKGTINSVQLDTDIRLKRDGFYQYSVSGKNVNFTGTITNPVTVQLTIGSDNGVITDPNADINK